MALLLGAAGPHVVCPACLALAPQTEGPIEQAQLTLGLSSEDERRDLMVAVIEQIERTQARLSTDISDASERAALALRGARLQGLFSRLCTS